MDNAYLQNKNKNTCNGCGICALGCPTEAIKMVEDNEGFYYPQIDESKCIKCNKCKRICSNFNDSENESLAYMSVNKNKQELENSASGGMFYILAKYTISKKGVVFGVEYGENLKVQHNHYETLEECKKFQGSKYVRSDIGNSYQKVKEFLENDRYVLFTGTSCQCNALKVYLGKEYEKLIICDVVCHANPSQKVFDKYIHEKEALKRKKIIDYQFRTKENGWHNQNPIIVYEDGQKEEDSLFFKAFVSELINRPSCGSCEFASYKRVTDFSLADFWGIQKVMPDIVDNDTGISLFLVNSNKAKSIFNEINQYMEYKEVNMNEAFKYNHNSNVAIHKKREYFFENLDKKPIMENINKCLKVSLKQKIIKNGKRIIKKALGILYLKK